MAGKFDYFVIFADMRTGSNFLESCINQFENLKCFGEAFNLNFIGFPNSDKILDITFEEREKRPDILVDKIKNNKGPISGFRYFHDHDPRIVERLLQDGRCGKIILTRRAIDSYVSLKIAQETDQWKLTNVSKRKETKITFDLSEFQLFLERRQTFSDHIERSLKLNGQTAFRLSYTDLRDIDVINGLGKFLGIDEKLEKLNQNLKPQNPMSLDEKVTNFQDMTYSILSLVDPTENNTPDYEPQRPASIPNYIVSDPLNRIFLPIPGGDHTAITDILDQKGALPILTEFSQRSLKEWKVNHPHHRSFTILRHPIERAYHVFCGYILNHKNTDFDQVRRKLHGRYNVSLPQENETVSIEQHKSQFLGFLRFLRSNLLGQTTIRVDPRWASQSSIIQGFARFVTPDEIIRQDESTEFFDKLFQEKRIEQNIEIKIPYSKHAEDLSNIYCPKLEAACRSSYQKDYMMFGFSDYQPVTSN